MGSSYALTQLPGPDPWARAQEQSTQQIWSFLGGHQVGILEMMLRRNCKVQDSQLCSHARSQIAVHTFFFRQATNESHLYEQLVFLCLKDSGTNPAILTPAATPLLPAGRSFCSEIPINSGVWPRSCDCYSHLSSLSNPTQPNAGPWSSLMLYMGSFLQVTEQSG